MEPCKLHTKSKCRINGGGSWGSRRSAAAVGLGIVMQISQSDNKPVGIVVKSSLTKRSTSLHGGDRIMEEDQLRNPGTDHCFLQACFLCNKKFRQDRDIYMYSGEGFCSIECRERKIKMDEMKNLQESIAKRMTASPRHCSYNSSPDAAEIRLLREELRRRRDHVITPKTRTVVS